MGLIKIDGLARRRTSMKRRNKVALVLSSGGARGYVHIGAIAELIEQGYEITSVAGTSMGALIGGMYAAGRLEDVSQWMRSLGTRDILSLVDVSVSFNHVVKGQKVMDALRQIVPDMRIEDLPVPYCAVASDVRSRGEVVFRSGSLYEAIRASISIPSFFKPVARGEQVFIDGGTTNPLPLNRVERTEDDLLAAVNVNAPSDLRIEQARERAERIYKKENPIRGRMIPPTPSVESNYYTLVSKSFSLMIESLSSMSIKLTPPDLLVDIPMNRFGGFDYGNADRMIRFGRLRMREAISEWQRMEHEVYG